MRWAKLEPHAITGHIVADISALTGYAALCGRRPREGRTWVAPVRSNFTACSRCTLAADRRGFPRPPRSA